MTHNAEDSTRETVQRVIAASENLRQQTGVLIEKGRKLMKELKATLQSDNEPAPWP